MQLTLKKTSTFFVVLLFSASAFAQSFRWDVKTLTDDSGIDWLNKLENARDNRLATIEGLTTKTNPFFCNFTGRNTRRSDEKRVVRIKVRLIEIKTESNDKDYHIVIQSLTNSNNFMVAEVPDPSIPEYEGDEYAFLREHFTNLREEIKLLVNQRITQQFKPFPLNTIVTLLGVPFYDCNHPSPVRGESKNSREIHPVLDID